MFKLFKRKQKSIYLPDFIDQYVKQSRLKKNYLRSFKNISRKLISFEKSTKLSIYSNDLDDEAIEYFIQYLKDQNLMLSTVNDYTRRVLMILKKVHKKGYDVAFSFERLNLKEEQSCAVSLTLEELERLNNLKHLSKKAKVVRDRFLIGCFTALRISDYRNISSKNIIKNTIQIKTQKTGEIVIIPIHPTIYDVFKRNNNGFPPYPKTSQSFGKTIKRVCKKAGITDKVIWERTRGNKVIRKTMRKYELITSHTARRTGATNMYLSGIQTARIMLITGHKTESSFFKYIRIEKQKNAEELSMHAFFK